MRAGHHRVVKEPHLSGLDQWGLTPRIGNIEHKVQRPTHQLGERPDGPGKAKGLEPPHAQGMSLSDDFLIIAVGAFTGAARPIETLPRLRAALDRPNETRVVFERHPMAIAQDAVAVRAVLPFLERTREAADILPRVRLVIVAIGVTQTTAEGRGRAVLIITSVDEGLRIEVFVARIIVRLSNLY